MSLLKEKRKLILKGKLKEMTESMTKGVDCQSNSEVGSLEIEKFPDFGFTLNFNRTEKVRREGFCYLAVISRLFDENISPSSRLLNPRSLAIFAVAP